MVLDRQGGPNWAENWCVAPVIVDPDADEVYFTPIYYALSHFSKYIRPEAKRLGIEVSDEALMATAAKNLDGSIAVIIFNEGPEEKFVNLALQGKEVTIKIPGQAIQTVLLGTTES